MVESVRRQTDERVILLAEKIAPQPVSQRLAKSVRRARVKLSREATCCRVIRPPVRLVAILSSRASRNRRYN
jgi:hypothetical protein